MTQAGKAVIDQQEGTEAGASGRTWALCSLYRPSAKGALSPGAWGPLATNKRHRVYTGALLATITAISIQKKGLNVIRFGGILNMR